jgi:hypothetical protein
MSAAQALHTSSQQNNTSVHSLRIIVHLLRLLVHVHAPTAQHYYTAKHVYKVWIGATAVHLELACCTTTQHAFHDTRKREKELIDIPCESAALPATAAA